MLVRAKKPMTYPIEITTYLTENPIQPCTRYSDGRRNSQDNEDRIVNALLERYGSEIVEVPPSRHWWDIKLFQQPYQIKSSEMTRPDNLSSKLALVYALTNRNPDDFKDSWQYFYDALINHKEDLGRDYFYIVHDKRDGTVHLQSIRTLARLKPNGSNLPFQIKWEDNLIPVERTFDENYEFLISVFKESVRKRLIVHNDYEHL